MSTPQVDYAALAQQAGAVNAQPAQPQSAAPATQGVDYAALAKQAGAVNADSQSESTPDGEQVNDIGKTVIVPKEGESFSDTIARVAAQGKKTTQQDINDEVATAPKKVATTLAAAPVIGAAGAASLAGAGEVGAAIPAMPAAAEKVLQLSETALEHLAENYPQLTKLASRLGYGVGAAGAYKLLNKLGIH